MLSTLCFQGSPSKGGSCVVVLLDVVLCGSPIGGGVVCSPIGGGVVW